MARRPQKVSRGNSGTAVNKSRLRRKYNCLGTANHPQQNIKTDHEVQVMEDALCLVFLEFQYEDFRKEHDEEQVTRIIRKTWKKIATMAGPPA
jgi:hypothetical protein